jgi:AraC-like DNA-binding protein
MARTRNVAQFPSGEALHRATVAAGFVRGMVSALPSRRIGAARVLEEAGIDPACLTNAGVRIPIEGYARLYNTAAARLGDEGFGLFSTPLAPGTFEFLCRGVISSASLAEALERAARFLAIVLPDLAVTVRREADMAFIEIRERRRLQRRLDDPRRVFAFEWLLRLVHGLGCWLAARTLTLDAVAFPYRAPPHAAEYARVYTEHPSFGAAHLSARFDARLLALPVRRSEDDLAAFLEGAPGRISMLYRPDREIARAVRQLLAEAPAEGADYASVARRLHLSPRTLHRRLAQEGTSYRALRDAVRREQALQMLEKTTQSIADIAVALGYSEPSAFFRAFVAWTGMAPTLYRNRNKFA